MKEDIRADQPEQKEIPETAGAQVPLKLQLNRRKIDKSPFSQIDQSETYTKDLSAYLTKKDYLHCLQQAGTKTSNEAGNASNTSRLLCQALISKSLRSMSSGLNPLEISKGIKAGERHFIDYLQSVTQDVKTREQFQQIATTAAHGDMEVGQLVAEAIEKTTDDNLICLKQTKKPFSTLQATEDMSFKSGYLASQSEQGDEKVKIVYEDPLLLLTNYKISATSSITSLIEDLIPTNRPLLIIADTQDGEALPAFIISNQYGRLRAAVVKAPKLGGFNREMLEDLAILTGGRVIDKHSGDLLEDASPSDLGSAKQVEVTEDFTSIIDGQASRNAIDQRKEELCRMLNKQQAADTKEKLKERMALLSGGIAIINLAAGSAEEYQLKERKAKAAIHACRAARQEGMVPGGGIAFAKAHKALSFLKGDKAGQQKGIEIFRDALLAPVLSITENGQMSGSEAVQKILEGSFDYGYNAATGRFESLLKTGIADATKSLRLATENAVKASSAILEAQEENRKVKAG